MYAVPLCVAAFSAAGFALSTSFQHYANADLPVDTGSGRAFAVLLRRPLWVVGQVLAMISFSLHAVALDLGALLVVQPVVVSGIVLAVPIRSALSRRLPRRGEVGTVAMTAFGLALFLLASRPRSSRPPDPRVAALATVATAVLAAAIALWAGRRSGPPRAAGYGLAGGALFGATAGLVKVTAWDQSHVSGIGRHLWVLVTAWPAWAVVVTGLSGVVLNQRAYRSGPLAASMPVLKVVDVLVAIAFGIVVFGEVPGTGPAAVVGQVVALTLMAGGLWRVASTDVGLRR